MYKLSEYLTIEEPDAGNPLVRVCGGAGRQRTALPGNLICDFSQTSMINFHREFHTLQMKLKIING